MTTVRLGIGDLLGSAALALRRGGRPIGVCVALWAGADFACSATTLAYDPAIRLLSSPMVAPVFNPATHDPFDVRQLVDWIHGSFRELVGFLFVAIMLRIILTGRAGPSTLAANGLGPASWSILLVGLLVTAANYAPWLVLNRVTGPPDPSSVDGVISIAATLVFGLAILYGMARLCLLYPSVAIGRGWTLGRQWQRTKGNGLRLMAIIVMALVFALFVDGLLSIFVFDTVFVDASEAESRTILLVSARRTIEYVPSMTFLLAVAAVAYARLTDYPAVHIPGTSRSPEQLAQAFE